MLSNTYNTLFEPVFHFKTQAQQVGQLAMETQEYQIGAATAPVRLAIVVLGAAGVGQAIACLTCV
jgi:hypothetical protein